MQKYTIKRDGKPPILFTGELLADADNKDYNSTRWTVVKIFSTKGGKIVALVRRLSIWEGENGSDNAESFPDLGGAIEWLKDGDASLGSVSQEAIEEAVCYKPELAKFWVQEVE